MIKILLLLSAVAALMSKPNNDPAANQLVDFKKETAGPIGILTTSAGAPVQYKDAISTLNTNLLANEYLYDVTTHLNRERIPERVVHANGAGAFGYFETTHDISHICKAEIFRGLGKITPVAVRFSLLITEKGDVETSRDIRGFAVKFYVKDETFDIVGLNTPIFPIKDPILFGSLIHSQKRNPATNLFDRNSYWDFMTLRPESFFALLLIQGNRGIPDGYRHMPGYGVHTYEIYNENGEKSYVRFQFTPEAGIKSLNNTEAAKISSTDADYATRDLYNAIANNKYPSWILNLQILSENDKKNASFDIYDTTRKLPEDLYPLHPVGRLVLNKNPINYFAEIEQLAFCPGNLVSGILGSPDKLFELRRLAYKDAQNYRLGVNYNKIPVNCPFQKALTYTRDGVSPVNDNGRDVPNYYPNSFHGPVPYVEKNRPSLSQIYESDANNFDQASNYYSNELTSEERDRLVENIITVLCPAASFLKVRAINIFTTINLDLGRKIARGVASQCPKL